MNRKMNIPQIINNKIKYIQHVERRNFKQPDLKQKVEEQKTNKCSVYNDGESAALPRSIISVLY